MPIIGPAETCGLPGQLSHLAPSRSTSRGAVIATLAAPRLVDIHQGQYGFTARPLRRHLQGRDPGGVVTRETRPAQPPLGVLMVEQVDQAARSR